ncbi:hypothetical protein, partial [Pyrobaculum sp.]|uniref:hypothetical protein n=1 Tax=Pyrobaculum sp. TaxID=2004705 RepID=UPI003D0CA8BC
MKDVYIIRLNIESPEDGELKAVVNSVASTLYYYMHKYFYHHPTLGFLSFEPPYEKLKELL